MARTVRDAPERENNDMSAEFPFVLLDHPGELARCQGWSEDVYRDLLAVQCGRMTREALDREYLRHKAILALDLTGFTSHCLHGHQAHAFLRILDAQKICVPVMRECEATLIRAFADDLVALFDTPRRALEAAFEIHRRVAAFNASSLAGDAPAECCIGIGFGDVYEIGANLAMGDEMNRAARLGEDVARGFETLVTANVHEAAGRDDDVRFEPQRQDDVPFPFWRALRAR
jgi:adenylate cyclase